MNGNGFASNVLKMPLHNAVTHVTAALRCGGFDVLPGVAVRSEKRANDGSRAGGFQVLGVSRCVGTGGTESMWWNIVLSESGSTTTRVTSVDPLSVGGTVAQSRTGDAVQARDRLVRIIARL